MKFAGSVLAALITVTTTVGDGAARTSRPIESSFRTSRIGSTLSDPPYAPVQIGDRAPDFTWVGVDNRSHRLREVLDQASALLIFAPTDEVLSGLESERDALAQIAVVPVVVMDGRAKSAFNRVKRAGAHLLVAPDPQRVIGAQFSLLDAGTTRLLPGWYAIDRKGIVRGFGGEMNSPEWTRLAASALAIPAPDVPLPASKTR